MPDATSSTIDTLLTEERLFKPSDKFVENANISDPDIYKQAEADPEAFWAGFAEQLVWKKKWSKVLEWNPPDAKWFVGGRLNITESTAGGLFQNGGSSHQHCHRQRICLYS